VISVPACLRDLLPPEHLACRVWEMVERLDLSEFYISDRTACRASSQTGC